VPTLLLIGIVFLDQSTKWLVREAFVLGQSVPVLDGFVHLTHHHNTGAAFGLFQNQTAWLAALSLVFIAVTFVYISRRPTRPFFLPLHLILGGAISNAMDRLFLGYVVDFIDLRVWPIFNIADSAITIGVLWILISAFKRQGGAKVRA